MGKKNKNKNQNTPQFVASQTTASQPAAPAVASASTWTIVVDSEAEKSTFEEQLRDLDSFCESRRAEAEKYYEEKKGEAEALIESAERTIEKRVQEAIEQEKRKMRDEIASAQREAAEIREKAEVDATELLKGLKAQQKELEQKCEEQLQVASRLEKEKFAYKEEILKKLQEETEATKAQIENLEATIDDLTKRLKAAERESKGLQQELDSYEDELRENETRRSELKRYELQMESLEADKERLNAYLQEQKTEIDRLKNLLLLYGDDPARAMKENEELQKRIRELESFKSLCPSEEELRTLRDMASKYTEILNEKIKAVEQCKALEEENAELKSHMDEINFLRRFIKILELQRAELQRELDRNIELYNSRTEQVFANLSAIDREEKQVHPNMTHKKTLKALCEEFRGYLAHREKNPLYYDEITIRTFIAGFASSRLMILEGLSGTGKSSLPCAFADFMGSKTIIVPVQSSWKDRHDLLGFYNDFKKQYKETEFLKALYRASSDPHNIYIIVLDEMNLSRIEYYFADLLSVLEKPNVEDWELDLIPDFASISHGEGAWPKLIHDGKLRIMDNTWFVGTANRDDSTFIITDKVYDRSVVLAFNKKGEKGGTKTAAPIQMNNDDFQKLLDAITFKESDKEKFEKLLKMLDSKVTDLFEITFGNRIANQLGKFVPVYIACGGTVDEAVDVMFSRKVLRKLEGLYDENTKLNLELLKEELEKSEYKLPITIAAIEKMTDKI